MTFSEARLFVRRHIDVIFFVGGFLFDAIALQRIDSVLDLAIQFFYLALIGLMVVRQARVDQGRWTPGERVGKLWHYNVEALHFIYGALLSAYVIFYFKSSTFSRSAFFLILVTVLMFANEMPQVRRAGFKMRVGLYTFCVVSYLNYLLPVLIGRMGAWVFALAVLLSAGVSWVLVKYLARHDPDPRLAMWRLGWAPAAMLFLISVLYYFKVIPPVPLSMQYAGVFHKVERVGPHYELSYRDWPWYQFWRADDRPFLARPADVIYCFVRVFGPRRFREQIYLHWSYRAPNTTAYVTSDRIPLALVGGRGEGFRGYAGKSNYQAGRWRVEIETSDGRPLGEVDFEVRPDAETDERLWEKHLM